MILEENVYYFETEQEYANHVNSSAYTEPFVGAYKVTSGASSSVTVVYNLKEMAEPLTFEIISGGTLYFGHDRDFGQHWTIEYSKNDGEWTSVTSSYNDGSGTTIATVVSGDIIKFRGENNNYGNNSGHALFKNSENCYYYAYGNVMSLHNKNTFVSNKTLPEWTFYYFFYNCTGLMLHPTKPLHLPATTFGNSTYDGMFCGCTSLTKMPQIPTSITKYCPAMFSHSGLEEVKLPDNIATIDNYLFQTCTNLRTINLPQTITTIGNFCFNECSSLVIGELNLPNLTTIYAISFAGTSRNCITKILSLGNITEIPGGNLGGGYGMFSFQEALTYVHLHNGITNIGDGAFWGCTALPSIELPSTLTRVGRWAFRGCTSLQEITLPASVTTIDNNCFWECSSLTTVTCLATTPPTMPDANTFNDCTSLSAIYVPSASVNDYKTANYWSNYASIIQAIP